MSERVKEIRLAGSTPSSLPCSFSSDCVPAAGRLSREEPEPPPIDGMLHDAGQFARVISHAE